VPDSDADAFEWEVREPGEDGEPRLKRVLRPEMLQPGALEALLRPAAAAAGAPAVAPQSVVALAGMPPPLQPMPGSGLPPPPLVPEPAYHLGIRGQQYGPYTAAQIGQMLGAGQVAAAGTKVWRPGLAGWVDLLQLPELAPWLPPGAAVPPPLTPPPLTPPPLN
jgi:hypothetical protein